MLDHAGCSRATKKKLMRQAAEDVTDGYTHAELGEMLAAMVKVETPLSWASVTAIATGTRGKAGISDTENCGRADHQQDQSVFPSRRRMSRQTGGSMDKNHAESLTFSTEIVVDDASCPIGSLRDLPVVKNRDIVRKTGPSTQVD